MAAKTAAATKPSARTPVVPSATGSFLSEAARSVRSTTETASNGAARSSSAMAPGAASDSIQYSLAASMVAPTS